MEGGIMDMYDTKNELIREIKSAKEKVILMSKKLRLEAIIRENIEDAINRKVTVSLIYEDAGKGKDYDEEMEWCNLLNKDYFNLLQYKTTFFYNIYLTENMVIFTSMPLKLPFNVDIFGYKFDKNIDNEKYDNTLQKINSVIDKSESKIGNEKMLPANKYLEIGMTTDIFSLLRRLGNNIVTETLNHTHIGGIWITNEKFTEHWKGGVGKTSYPKKWIINAFKDAMPELSEDDKIKGLDNKIVICYIKIIERKLDHVRIDIPFNFNFENEKFYFNVGKLEKILSKEECPKWIHEFIKNHYNNYVSFFKE